MKMYTKKDFEYGKVVISVPTDKMFKKLMVRLEQDGYNWPGGQLPTEYSPYDRPLFRVFVRKQDACIIFEDGVLKIIDKASAVNSGKTIINPHQINFKEPSEEDNIEFFKRFEEIIEKQGEKFINENTKDKSPKDWATSFWNSRNSDNYTKEIKTEDYVTMTRYVNKGDKESRTVEYSFSFKLDSERLIKDYAKSLGINVEDGAKLPPIVNRGKK